jgi:hypothetical protein
MSENVSPQVPLRLLLKVDGMNCAVRDGKKIVAALLALPAVLSAQLLFPSRCIVLQSDSKDPSFFKSSALKCIQLLGYAAAVRAPTWSAVSLAQVNCITAARPLEHLLHNHPAVIAGRLDFPARRIYVLSDGNSSAAVAAAAQAGWTRCSACAASFRSLTSAQALFPERVNRQ